MAHQLKLTTAHAASDKKKLNEEWIELVNETETPFNAEGCSITVNPRGSKSRPRTVTTLKAGLVIKPGERVRLISGSSGKSSHGEAPDEGEGARNFHLFLKAPYLTQDGLAIRFVTKQQAELCRTTFTR